MAEYDVSQYPVTHGTDVFWWLKGLKRSEEILSALRADVQMASEVNDRLEAYQTYASLYNNRRVYTGSPLLAQIDTRWLIGSGNYTRVPYNLMKQVIDEATSRIVKSQPKARFLSHGGDQEAQRRALLMQRWNDSQVYQHYQSEAFGHVIKDACVYGLGALKITKAYKENRLDVKRVYPGNLFVDLEETRHDKPRRLHHRIPVPKNALRVFFPKFEKEIEGSNRVTTEGVDLNQFFNHSMGSPESVELIESWHLPSYEGAGDGIRVLWIDQAILQIEKYERRVFPFAFFNWKKDPNNTFYGTGLGEDLLGVHIDANVTINRVNTAIEYAAVPTVFYRKGSIEPSALTNAPGQHIAYSGDQPPQVVVPTSVPQDLLMYVREHEARAYKIAGLAASQAFGDRVPSGLETGKAVQNYFNVESVPFAQQLRKYEYFVEDVANCNVAVGREIAKKDPKWEVVVPDKRNTIEVLRWEDVALDPRETAYVIRALPASQLSETPAARIDDVYRLQGIFPDMPSDVRADLLQMTDVDAYLDEMTGPRENGKAMIGLALRKGKFTPPSPMMNLQQFIIDATNAEQRAERMGVSEKNISTLRLMITRANELRQRQVLARMMQQEGLITPAAVPTDESGVSPTASN